MPGIMISSPPSVFMGAEAHRTATQSINDGTDTVLLWTAEDYDTNSIHDTSSNTSRFVVPTGGAGKWRITCNLLWTPNATGVRDLYFKKNGTTRLQEDLNPAIASPFHTSNNLSIDILLADGDYIEAFVYQTSGGPLTVSVDFANPTMSAFRIGS